MGRTQALPYNSETRDTVDDIAKDYFLNHDDHHIDSFRRHMEQSGFQLSTNQLENLRERFLITR